MQTHYAQAKIRMGTGMGKEILVKLKEARSSIKIVTPYISADFVDLLNEKAAQGLDVKLVLSSDVGKDKAESIRKLISQQVHTDYRSVNARSNGITLMNQLTWGLLALMGLGFYFSVSFWWLLIAGIPVLRNRAKIYRKMRTKTYSYSLNLNVKFPLSPFTNSYDAKYTLVHSKVFIIDDDLAYTGSVNFTKQAFFYNYETLIGIKDQRVLTALIEEFDHLFSGALPCLDAATMARFAYREPYN